MNVMHKENVLLGVLLACIASFFFTLTGIFSKYIGDGASCDTILFARFFISLILLLPWVIQNPKEALVVPNRWQVVFRSVFTLLSLACFFYAIRFITLTDALLLNNTYPLFVPVVAWCFVRVKTPWKVWAGIAIGFMGIVFVLKPDTHFLEGAALIALCSGVFSAISIVIIRTLTKVLSILQILFYNFLLCTFMSALFLPLNWVPISENTVILLGLLGVSGALYQYFSTMAFAKAPVRLISPIMFLSVVLGTIADFFLWGNIPDFLSFIGMGCIIMGGVVVIYFGKREISSNLR